jgi:hypothetical protein
MLPQDERARFIMRFDRNEEGCWEWKGSYFPNGYGQFWSRSKRSSVKAHRFAWEMENGSIQEGMIICHKCDNPRCVRVSHLFLGTAADNSADMIAKGRAWAHAGEKCPRALLTTVQVAEIRAKYKRGVYGYKRLGKEYGVVPGTIERIIKNQTWRQSDAG